jgi:hypothetical protein
LEEEDMKVNWAKAIVLIMAIEDFGVSVVYLFQGNFKLSLYWALAGGLAGLMSTF